MNGLNQVKMIQSHFNKKESYLHNRAIDVLDIWILDNPREFNIDGLIRTEKERHFSLSGKIKFIPDLTVYNDKGICKMYEVCHTHGIDIDKLMRMQYYFYMHNWDVEVYEISAYYIMKQVKCPERIEMIKYI